MNDAEMEVMASGAPYAMMKGVRDILRERARQYVKWGKQSWPNGTGNESYKTYEEAAKGTNEANITNRTENWADILEEEFWEAMAEADETKLRAELIQVAAVALAWIEDIDTRGGK